MKYQRLKELESLLILTKESLRTYEGNDNRLNFNLKYWLNKGKVISLKKGIYISSLRWEKELDKDLYMEYLANKLYEPSYISAEYVLNKNSLLTEAVYNLTSVTTRKTNSFTNKLGRFFYYSISPPLFSGFSIKPFYSSSIFIASKSKAVFDYLYFRFIKNTVINEKTIEELRINWENLAKGEFGQIKQFVNVSKSNKMRQVFDLIGTIHYA